MKRIYVLHERGVISHYRALVWCDDNNQDVKVIFREFAILKRTLKAIITFDLDLFKKQFINMFFLISLVFSRNKNLIIGIAPYDWRLLLYYPFLKNHRYFYHTSQTSWGYVNYSKKFLSQTRYSKKIWTKFIDYAEGIFCVSQKTADEITKNYNPKAIAVVNHSIEDSYQQNELRIGEDITPITCLFVGRLWEIKGIKLIFELIDSVNPDKFNFGFVGRGELENEIQEFVKKRANCKFYGYLKNPELRKIYDQSDILLAPSLRTENWEEFFGMVLVEGMARGLVPIATDHSGPKEIIQNGIAGFLVKEVEFIESSKRILNSLYDNKMEFEKLKKGAFAKGQSYNPENIFNKWNSLLNIKMF
tara:strand:+ start:888 stop:1970 length:1083 start_codon:yes stop_codon:yes gene_type:complete